MVSGGSLGEIALLTTSGKASCTQNTLLECMVMAEIHLGMPYGIGFGAITVLLSLAYLPMGVCMHPVYFRNIIRFTCQYGGIVV